MLCRFQSGNVIEMLKMLQAKFVNQTAEAEMAETKKKNSSSDLLKPRTVQFPCSVTTAAHLFSDSGLSRSHIPAPGYSLLLTSLNNGIAS